jgi:hypothetical protein
MSTLRETQPNRDVDTRSAMRAYLQRGEVRLSTMHRVAGLFINGAGLLILFPFLFQGAVREIAGYMISGIFTDNIVLSLMFISLLAPFIISLVIPLYALYLLIKDLVYFYFASYSLGFPMSFFNPRFALAGLAFPTDEGSDEVRKNIYSLQYTTNLRNFVLPMNQNIASYFNNPNLGDDIIPKTRTTTELERLGILQQLSDEDKKDIRPFNNALGLAGFLERPLIEEVARMEVSLVRHAISLRRLVLRYIKALLSLIWTTLVSFFIATLYTTISQQHISVIIILLAFSIIYGMWSWTTPKIIRLPIKWLFENNPQLQAVRDIELVRFEKNVQLICFVGTIASAVVLIAAMLIQFKLLSI